MSLQMPLARLFKCCGLSGAMPTNKQKPKAKHTHTESDIGVARTAITDLTKVIKYLNNHFAAHAIEPEHQGNAGKFAAKKNLSIQGGGYGHRGVQDATHDHQRTETQAQSEARQRRDHAVYEKQMKAGKAAQEKAENERWQKLDPAAKLLERAAHEEKFHADHPDWTPEQWAERKRKYAERQEKIRENKLKRQARIEE